MLRRNLLLAGLCLASLLPVPQTGAQDRTRAPKRPRLAAAADTNSAAAYYSHGVDVMRTRPYEAADAFYWATRIDPGMADAWYARRIAHLMARPERFGASMEGNRRVAESREMRSLDSLHLRALTLNPFLRTRFDKTLFDHFVHWSVQKDSRGGSVDRAEVQYWIDSWLRSGGSRTRAWVSYAEGRFPDALAAYASALRGSRNPAGIHADRARIFLLVGRPDSAVAEMGRAVERLRERDEKDLVFLYESKALFEHSTGLILEQQGKGDAAREAYGRALQEDLSYYPAHVALATLSLASGDTAAALASLDLAAQIRGGDAGVRYAYGQVLALSGRHPEAEEQLRAALEAEPWFAPPYALLGGVLETTGRRAEALETYRAFLARSARVDPMREVAQARLAALGGEAAP